MSAREENLSLWICGHSTLTGTQNLWMSDAAYRLALDTMDPYQSQLDTLAFRKVRETECTWDFKDSEDADVCNYLPAGGFSYAKFLSTYKGMFAREKIFPYEYVDTRHWLVIKQKFETCFPLVQVSRKCLRVQPWITTGLKLSIRQSHRLYRKTLQESCPHMISEYKKYIRVLLRNCLKLPNKIISVNCMIKIYSQPIIHKKTWVTQ